ncbi:uncharacterized protein YcfL [Flavobacterium sp. HSC-32F16]|uniref:hypothetical protein n=1 Tax=Flavobacterium sp. HSC-32F16 TaxID=2910964 RepID=UPI0020A45003|nr:hypothetical protein [Flavobacterium sp. HSC-32F16]MCP2026287.1 uncharacterized protein YcfL [Flavobacterium sp. HSC-32F16]
MKKVCILLFSLIVISCKNKPDQKLKNDIKKEVVSSSEKALKIDTIGISGNDVKSNYIVASLLKNTVNKDSTETVQYNLDFYVNKEKITSESFTINDYVKDSEWIANYGFSPDDDSSVSPFIQLDFGFQASGFLQKQYLYFLNKKEIQLIHEWESSNDAGWGNWTEFLNVNPKKVTQSFYFRNISFMPKNDDDSNIGIASYSDSTKIYFENNHWKKQLLTPKDKIYRKKEITWDDFYPKQ